MDQFTIEAARRGDRDAQAALLRGLQDLWFRYCVSQLGNVERARDAAQETGLRVLRQLSGFRGDSRVETWSLGIALNVVREMRRTVARVEVTIQAAAERQQLPGGDPADSVGADELALLRDVLGRLPDRQRHAIVLRFLEERSVEETAQIMQCAPGTVKATVHQALRSLRQRLSGEAL